MTELPDEPTMLVEIYRESGEQARHARGMQLAYTGWFLIGIAIIVSFLAGLPVEKQDDVYPAIWLFPWGFSAAGLLLSFVASVNISRALKRQYDISADSLSGNGLVLLGLDPSATRDARSRNVRPRRFPSWADDWLFQTFYGTAFVAFAIAFFTPLKL